MLERLTLFVGSKSARPFWAVLLLLPVSLCRADANKASMINTGKKATALVEIRDGTTLRGYASAFCIDKSGIFVTNSHVARSGAKDNKLTLVLDSGARAQRPVAATVLKADPDTDLAILRADYAGPYDSLQLSDTAGMSGLTETDQVTVFGFPLGEEMALREGARPEVTVVTSRITALRHDQGELQRIQLDGSITHGNSGGPVVNDQGKVVGIIQGGAVGTGIAFAIPASLVGPLLKAALAAGPDQPAASSASVDAPPADAGATTPAATTAPSIPSGLKRPMPKPAPTDPNALTDEIIGQTIKKGVNYLYGQIDPKTHTVVAPVAPGAAKVNDNAYNGGMDALVVYSLMQCSLANNEDDPRISCKLPEMRAMIAAMENYNLNVGQPQTYAHGLRATALALYISTLHLPEGKDAKPNADSVEYEKAVKVMEDDTAYGLFACDGGAYTYVKPPDAPKDARQLLLTYNNLKPNNLPNPKGPWDNSNSQYGLLGVWSAVDAEVGIEIPIQYWALVNHHWEMTQLADGGWGYTRGPGGPGNGDTTLSMTCAGLASEFVTHEYLEPVQLGDKPGRIPFSPTIKKGLEWFEKRDNCIKDAPGNGYALYGVERVGLACGFKFFGQHDWYRELATHIVAAQTPAGSFPGGWGNEAVNTAYSLLFLARGRHPIIMNKLRFDTDGNKGIGYWLNRPEDAANLARYVGHQLEHPLNWQVINVDTDWTQWLDSPILEIASHKEIKFTTEQIDKIRNYVESGGMLYVQADGDASEFNRMVPKLAKDLFPKYEFKLVPPDHPMYGSENGVYKIPARPDLKMVTNGARILILWSPRDISKYWQARDVVRHKLEFEFGANLFVYASGKRQPRNRLDSPYVPPATWAPIDTIKVARLDYAGNSDPEPGAWRRYVNLFQNQTGTKLALSTLKLGALRPGDAPIAHLTGTAKYSFSPPEIAAVKAYVEGGGVLLIDQCGGYGQFDQSVTTLLTQAFPNIVPRNLSPLHPVLAGGMPGAEDLSHRQPHYRLATIPRGLAHGTNLEILAAGKGHVIFTPLDITSGLLSTATGGILGFDSNYSEALMKNIIFWSVDGQPDK